MRRKSAIVDAQGEHFTLYEEPQGYASTVPPPRRDAGLQAYFDSAVFTPDNQQHWAFATSAHANDAFNRWRRLVTRNQARYETANNGYLGGMVDTLADDTIGDGPRLHLTTRDIIDSERQEIQNAWHEWSKKVNLAAKLWTGRRAKAVDGEAFYLLLNDISLDGPVTLNVRLIESEQCGSPYDHPDDQWHYDGVRVKESGDPLEYHIYYTHPYQSVPQQLTPLGEWYSSNRLSHLYNQYRPGQLRGISELIPALPLAAILRRYTYATLHSAEKNADISLVMKTTASPDDDDCTKPFFPTYSPVPFDRNMLVNLPYGWDIEQIRAEHPSNNYTEFERQIVIQMGRCLSMPATVALGDSSNYNFASGRLDHRVYDRAIDNERKNSIEPKFLDEPLFNVWIVEYIAQTRGASPRDVRPEWFPHEWYWTPRKTDDPVKDAQATEILFKLGLITDEQWHLQHGNDPESHYRSLQDQNTRRAQLGMPMPGQQPGMPGAQPSQPGRPAEPVESGHTRNKSCLHGLLAGGGNGRSKHQDGRLAY